MHDAGTKLSKWYGPSPRVSGPVSSKECRLAVRWRLKGKETGVTFGDLWCWEAKLGLKASGGSRVMLRGINSSPPSGCKVNASWVQAPSYSAPVPRRATVPKLLSPDVAEDCRDEVLELGRELVVMVLRWLELGVIDLGRWRLIDKSIPNSWPLPCCDGTRFIVRCAICCWAISSENLTSDLIVETAGSLGVTVMLGECVWSEISDPSLQASSNPLSCLFNIAKCWALEAPACSHLSWLV